MYTRGRKEREPRTGSSSKTAGVLISGWGFYCYSAICTGEPLKLMVTVCFTPVSYFSLSFPPLLNSEVFAEVEYRVNRSAWILLHGVVTGNKGYILNMASWE